MQAQSGCRSVLTLIFNFGAKCCWVVNAIARLLYSWKMDTVPIVREAEWASAPVWTGV